jgi:hypothetical protein
VGCRQAEYALTKFVRALDVKDVVEPMKARDEESANNRSQDHDPAQPPPGVAQNQGDDISHEGLFLQAKGFIGGMFP